MTVDPPEYDPEQDETYVAADWRPSKHPFVETGDGTCGTCGYLFPFGALHPEPANDPADEPEVGLRVCDGCGHTLHSKPCRAQRVRFVGVQHRDVQVCGCEVAA